MQVDDAPSAATNIVPNIIVNAPPNVVTNAAPSVAPSTAPNVVPDTAPNVVPDIAPNVIANVAPNTVPNIAPNPQPAMWPVETDLIFVLGTTRVMLTVQRPLMRSVIQDAFERVRVYLLFNNAFPDAPTVLSMTKRSLTEAAESRERASSIHQRLLHDEAYVTNMIRLVSHYTFIWPNWFDDPF